ncbi:MAG: pyridoxamine 5'-phosphate oxidase family protein [Candidatus Binatia bacterium]
MPTAGARRTGRSVRLTTDEAWALLRDAHTGILVTLRRDGVPIATPMWFAALDGYVYVRTPARSKKVGRLRRDARVTFLVEEGERWAELRAVHFTGRAEIVGDDPDLVARVDAELDRKYTRFRTARAAMPDPTRRHYETTFALIRVVPDPAPITWDNRKLGLA